MKRPAHYGYYVFLGLGDFRKHPDPMPPEWTPSWTAEGWERRLDDFAALGTRTLFVYLMGHRLPYPSARFPECVARDHPNVRSEFFQQVLDGAAQRNIAVVATLTTTGHADACAAARPEACMRSAAGERLANGILCHHHAAAREYALGVLEECLDRYHGFRGAIFHPPEFGHPCYCERCREEFQRLYGRPLADAPLEEARQFFMQTNLQFQRSVLEPALRQRLPQARLFTFTIPWVFESHFETIGREINPATVIVDWDYRLTAEHVEKVPDRLRRYRQFGHEVWFMPTCGYGFRTDRSEEDQLRAVHRQIELALGAGCPGIIYFMGPCWWPQVAGTSLHRRAEQV